jgi:hypothetical protein
LIAARTNKKLASLFAAQNEIHGVYLVAPSVRTSPISNGRDPCGTSEFAMLRLPLVSPMNDLQLQPPAHNCAATSSSAFALSLLYLFILSGCGGGDYGSIPPVPPPSPPPSSSQVTLNSVTLFILNSQSGIAQPISATEGNLLIVSYIGGPGDDLVNVFDNKGNTYVSSGKHGTSSDGGECFIFYAANATPGVTSITFDTLTDGNFDDANVYDVSGAASSPLDVVTNINDQHESSFGSITGPSITASTSDGIIVANVGIETNAITGSSSPWKFDPQDQNNGWAHVLNSSSGTFSPTWTTNQSEAPGGVGFWGGIAASFKSAPTTAQAHSAPTLSLPRTNSVGPSVDFQCSGLIFPQSQIFAASLTTDAAYVGVLGLPLNPHALPSLGVFLSAGRPRRPFVRYRRFTRF